MPGPLVPSIAVGFVVVDGGQLTSSSTSSTEASTIIDCAVSSDSTHTLLGEDAQFLAITCGDPQSATDVTTCGTAVSVANDNFEHVMPVFTVTVGSEAATAGNVGAAVARVFLDLSAAGSTDVEDVTGVALHVMVDTSTSVSAADNIEFVGGIVQTVRSLLRETVDGGNDDKIEIVVVAETVGGATSGVNAVCGTGGRGLRAASGGTTLPDMVSTSFGPDVVVFLALAGVTSTSLSDAERCGFVSGRYFPAEAVPGSFDNGGSDCEVGDFPSVGSPTVPSDFYPYAFAQGSVADDSLPTQDVNGDYEAWSDLYFAVSLPSSSLVVSGPPVSAASEVGGIVACAQTTSSALGGTWSVNFVVVVCDGSRGTVSELAASTESCRIAVASVQDALGAVSSIRVGVQMPVALYPGATGTEAETVTLAVQAAYLGAGLNGLGVDALVVELTELSSASNANRGEY